MQPCPELAFASIVSPAGSDSPAFAVHMKRSKSVYITFFHSLFLFHTFFFFFFFAAMLPFDTNSCYNTFSLNIRENISMLYTEFFYIRNAECFTPDHTMLHASAARLPPECPGHHFLVAFLVVVFLVIVFWVPFWVAFWVVFCVVFLPAGFFVVLPAQHDIGRRMHSSSSAVA